MSIAGRGNLFIDGKLLIDLSTDPPQGGSLFGLWTQDVRRIAPGLKAGVHYNLEIRANSKDFVEQSPPFACWGGIRLGAARALDPKTAIEDAVELAIKSDGGLSFVLGCYLVSKLSQSRCSRGRVE